MNDKIFKDPIYRAFYEAMMHSLQTDWLKKQSELGRQSGVSKGMMSEAVKGKKKLTFEKRAEIAKKCGCSYEEFINKGHGILIEKGEQANIKAPQGPEHTEIIVKAPTTKAQELLEENAANYRSVPLYESGRLAAWSNGAAFDQYEEATSQVIVYLPELGMRARHKLIAAKVGGDSMEPLIPGGSIVIIDQDDREFAKNQIFAVITNEGGGDIIAVKRVKKFEEAEGFALISENPEYSLRFVKEDNWLNLCVGRVVWMWRSFEG